MSENKFPALKRLEPIKIKNFIIDKTIYIVILVIFAVMAAIDPKIFEIGNIEFIINQAATRVILALGMASIILIGSIDVALGRVVGLAGIFVASLTQALDYSRRIYQDFQLPISVSFIGVILMCGIVMLIIGIIIAKIQIPPFIATLSFSLIIYGAMSIYFDETNDSSPIGGLDATFKNIAQGSINIGGFHLSYLVLFAVASALIIWFIWNKTVLGKNMYAVGGNPEAANICGVNITQTIIIVFAMAGLFYGLGGVLETGRVGSATSSLGYGYELDAIAACVVGGVSMRGGIGRVSGIIIGVLIFQLITYGLVFLGVNPYLQYLFKGVIILFAISVDTQKNIKKR